LPGFSALTSSRIASSKHLEMCCAFSQLFIYASPLVEQKRYIKLLQNLQADLRSDKRGMLIEGKGRRLNQNKK